jgi:hypothetical protein
VYDEEVKGLRKEVEVSEISLNSRGGKVKFEIKSFVENQKPFNSFDRYFKTLQQSHDLGSFIKTVVWFHVNCHAQHNAVPLSMR